MKSLVKNFRTPKRWQKLPLIFVSLVLLLLGFRGSGDIAGMFLLIFLLLVLLEAKVRRGSLADFKAPPRFTLYLLFLVLFSVSFLWSKNLSYSFIYFALFLSGALFWTASYNLKFFKKNFKILVIFLGIYFAGLTLINYIFGDVNQVWEFSLYRFAVAPLHHNHIGDLWALVIIILGVLYVERNDKRLLPLVILGFYLLLLSLSRSSYISLISGSVYLLWRLKLKESQKRIFWMFIVISILLFFYAGTRKATLSAHSGFLTQGVLGTFRNPFGVGVGGFELISKDLRNNPWGISGGSSSAHNIILDITTGMGILGVSFIAWFIMVLRDILQKEKDGGFMYSAVFITLSVNFLFDYTYLIPTMLWLWFISLGIAQKTKGFKH